MQLDLYLSPLLMPQDPGAVQATAAAQDLGLPFYIDRQWRLSSQVLRSNKLWPCLVKLGGEKVERGENATVRPQTVLLHNVLVVHLPTVRSH